LRAGHLECVCRRSASLYVPEASLKDFSSFVIAGLDPAIHAATELPLSLCCCISEWTTGS